MSKVRVAGFSLSVDGSGAGVEQSIDNPLDLPALGFQVTAHVATELAAHVVLVG